MSAAQKPKEVRVAWIKVVPQEDATGDLLDQYERMRDSADNVPSILAVHGLNPSALRAHFDLYRTLMFGHSALSRAQREMLAVVVSTTNACHY